MWICKPASSSRGRGIEIFDNLDDIVRYAKGNQDCIIQKYLEYPLLVENRKFDIRQWFLVTSWDPLELWIYHDGYARFCGKPFSLDDFNTNIHLTNQAIQSYGFISMPKALSDYIKLLLKARDDYLSRVSFPANHGSNM